MLQASSSKVHVVSFVDLIEVHGLSCLGKLIFLAFLWVASKVFFLDQEEERMFEVPRVFRAYCCQSLSQVWYPHPVCIHIQGFHERHTSRGKGRLPPRLSPPSFRKFDFPKFSVIDPNGIHSMVWCQFHKA